MLFRVLPLLLLLLVSNEIEAQETFEFDGIERTYYLDVPSDLGPGAPLVFVLHGYTSSAEVIRGYSGWSGISESEGVVVCYPQGTPDFLGVNHWNANIGISDTDDHGFLVALAQYLQETYECSPECTYSCGMSNGGFMSYSLACQESDTFKAIGSVTGAMSQIDYQTCNPATVVPVIHLHGTVDAVVGYEGGVGAEDWGTAGVEDIIDLWTGFMGTTQVTEVELPNEEIFDWTSVDFIRHYGAAEGQEFHHYRVNGGGHDWFGAWGSQDVQSTEVMWDFFQSHCEGAPLTVQQDAEQSNVLAYWTGSEFGVKVDAELTAYDLQGRVVWTDADVAAGQVLKSAHLKNVVIIELKTQEGKREVYRIR